MSDDDKHFAYLGAVELLPDAARAYPDANSALSTREQTCFIHWHARQIMGTGQKGLPQTSVEQAAPTGGVEVEESRSSLGQFRQIALKVSWHACAVEQREALASAALLHQPLQRRPATQTVKSNRSVLEAQWLDDDSKKIRCKRGGSLDN